MTQEMFRHVLTAMSVFCALLVGVWLSIKPRVIAGETAGESESSDSTSVKAPYVNVMDFGAHPNNDDNTVHYPSRFKE